MQRRGFDGLGATLAQAVQVLFGSGKLRVAQMSLLREKLASFIDIAQHEDAERHPQGVHRSLMECRQFLCTLRRKLKPALDFFRRKLAQILVDDISDMFE